MNSLKIIALVYCIITLWSYFYMSIKSPETITVRFLGTEKKISKKWFIVSNLLDGALIAVSLMIIFDL